MHTIHVIKVTNMDHGRLLSEETPVRFNRANFALYQQVHLFLQTQSMKKDDQHEDKEAQLLRDTLMQSLRSYPLPVQSKEELATLDGFDELDDEDIEKIYHGNTTTFPAPADKCPTAVMDAGPRQSMGATIATKTTTTTSTASKQQNSARKKATATTSTGGSTSTMKRRRHEDFSSSTSTSKGICFESHAVAKEKQHIENNQSMEYQFSPFNKQARRHKSSMTQENSPGTPSLRYYRPSKPPLSPSEWEVVLLLDHREVRTRTDRHYIQQKLIERGVNCEVRQLSLGDILWIVRPRNQSLRVSEWLLDYVIERKTVDDLAHSIKDGRYNEQKQRLSEFPCCKVTYLVEGALVTNDSAIKRQHLVSAMGSTQIHNEYNVQHTPNLDASVHYISMLHSAICDQVLQGGSSENRTSPPSRSTHLSLSTIEGHLSGRPGVAHPLTKFTTFQSETGKGKNMTTMDIFGTQLRQIPNCGASRAEVLLQQFPTPNKLYTFLVNRYEKEVENELSDEPLPNQKQKFGPSLIKPLHRIFTRLEYELPFTTNQDSVND